MSGTEVFGFVVAMYVWFIANPLVSLILYFLPIVIALIRKHKSTGMIVILGLLFGWIFLLWLILVVWASFGETKPKHPGDSTSEMTDEELKHVQERSDSAANDKARGMNIYK